MNNLVRYSAGLDVGSTTLKIVVINEKGEIVFSDYRRHNADITGELKKAFEKARLSEMGNAEISLAVTGSAGMGLSETYDIPFIQEVVAAAQVAERLFPDIKTLIDIGGEDAKMIFFSSGHAPDIRMNGSCAGGTGAFIDQVATLLGCDVSELDLLARQSTTLHPIASRCGVFAKTDIQNLLSRNVPASDIAASVFHAVAVQLVTTLARGREISPRLLFCGGPLAFIPSLRQACLDVMGIEGKDCDVPENAALVPALGCALTGETIRLTKSIDDFLVLFSHRTLEKKVSNGLPLPRLFEDAGHLISWKKEKEHYRLPTVSLKEYKEDICYLGIDSGSTTTKIVVIDPEENVLFTHYVKNAGNPLAAVSHGLALFHQEAEKAGKPDLKIVSAAVTGYGEDLIKAAFNFQEGLVETIAHYLAAQKLDPQVSFILDIGGQDMKAIFIEQGTIVRLDINEACSSGCGSFIEGFARSLNHTAAEFASLACLAPYPCDLGTRCTVFMNSKVKQSLREGSGLPDIAAGLAYSVIKNCLYKVLKLKNSTDLGTHIVVQGGTMRNHAVVRALEILTEQNVLFADLPELMGAYGAALHACRGKENHSSLFSPDLKENRTKNFSSCISLRELSCPTHPESEEAVCPGCENKCTVHKYTFNNSNTYFSGNKCERIFTNKGHGTSKGRNIYQTKFSRLFSRATTLATDALLTIGIPRALNYYENYPFWHALLKHCGIKVVLSSRSTFPLYEKGTASVMSDNICFPAKLVHGHIHDLAEKKVDRILMPFVVFENMEDGNAANSFNCPVVTGYSDVIRSSINTEQKFGIPLDSPAVSFKDKDLLRKSCRHYLVKTLGITSNDFEGAFSAALEAQSEYTKSLYDTAQTIAGEAMEKNRTLVVLAGRPYHTDPLIQHKIAELISGFGVDVISEDIVRHTDDYQSRRSGTIRQWAYTNRILGAAQWVAEAPENVHFVQLTSFGCGPDAFILDEVSEILRSKGKSHTSLKIDDINNLGSVRLRIRSLVESLTFREHRKKVSSEKNPIQQQSLDSVTPYTEKDRDKTLIAPFFSEIYSPFIPVIMKMMGYHLETLPPSDSSSIDYGLKYANNEVCYPATLIVGDIIRAFKSGQYKPSEVAVALTQTGGQCRASNYLSLIRKALSAAGYPEVPVVSVATSTDKLSDTQPGFKTDWKGNLRPLVASLLYSDRIAQMYYATVCREKSEGDAASLRDTYIRLGADLIGNRDLEGLYRLLDQAAKEFNTCADPDKNPPQIGLVGEIYVKYNSMGHKNIVDWLISQGIEVVVPPLTNFFLQEFPNRRVNRANYLKNKTFFEPFLDNLAYTIVSVYLRKFDKIASRFRYHHPLPNIFEEAEKASRVINLAGQYGEGWLIAAEMASFAERGIQNIVSVQPFGCIANHVVSKGIEKRIRDFYPDMSLLFLDLDSGASEANIMNRLHFLIQNARTGQKRLNAAG